ncbi:peptide-methionine (S)-S-oxide reductase MsrA [Fulvivirga lutea]|uniref:Peptide methionine sulfoxide reductase MsrA n=1 Tax=Fulvivirga lutea TaxID=2810512 RepID=A0A974WGG1_9BACT|nr:peptide-methionine (S)-S-oxide reductase MsrA [Fulvivirga lutea]QSE98053.1 peptide-methionine (S)-S-oxide reductase MsrA [Fulvivirga lutea]
MLKLPSILLISILMVCCAAKKDEQKTEKSSITHEQRARLDTAYFASGCFWCTEAVFERVKGVVDVVSGYAGGDRPNPTYQQVSAGITNYAEAVRIAYDPEVVSYKQLIEFFYASHDPTQLNRQGPDVGKQYRSEIYFQNDEEKKLAEARKEYLDQSGKYDSKVVTLITPYTNFYEAEDYHQNYYELHPNQPYVYSVSRPKVEKFMKEYKEFLKEDYK